jgi:hypothetical protein
MLHGGINYNYIIEIFLKFTKTGIVAKLPRGKEWNTNTVIAGIEKRKNSLN